MSSFTSRQRYCPKKHSFFSGPFLSHHMERIPCAILFVLQFSRVSSAGLTAGGDNHKGFFQPKWLYKRASSRKREAHRNGYTMRVRKKNSEEFTCAVTGTAQEDWETSAGSRGKPFTAVRTDRSCWMSPQYLRAFISFGLKPWKGMSSKDATTMTPPTTAVGFI